VVARWFGESFPWGTLVVNVTGSFIIGLFATLTAPEGRWFVASEARVFVMAGLCGGYTTFSSFSLQTLDLMRQGALTRAAVNVAASVVLCVAAVAVGHQMAALMNGGAQAVAQLPIEEEAS